MSGQSVNDARPVLLQSDACFLSAWHSDRGHAPRIPFGSAQNPWIPLAEDKGHTHTQSTGAQSNHHLHGVQMMDSPGGAVEEPLHKFAAQIPDIGDLSC